MPCGRDLPELAHWPYVVDCSTAIEEGTELQPAPGSDAFGLLRVGPEGLTWLPDPKAPDLTSYIDERTPAHLAVDMGPGEPRPPAPEPPPPPRRDLPSPARRIGKHRTS